MGSLNIRQLESQYPSYTRQLESQYPSYPAATEPVSLIYPAAGEPAAGEPVYLISGSWRASISHIWQLESQYPSDPGGGEPVSLISGSWRANLLHIPNPAAIQRLHFLRFPTFSSANQSLIIFESVLFEIPDVLFCELESRKF